MCKKLVRRCFFPSTIEVQVLKTCICFLVLLVLQQLVDEDDDLGLSLSFWNNLML